MSANVGFVFPGQGSQFPGMTKKLIESFPSTRLIFEEANDTLHENLLKLCEEGPLDTLTLTQNAQPAILTTSYAWYTVIHKETGIAAAYGAGHSLGEYTALLAAGALTLREAVQLVRTRGQLMQTEVPAGKGKMAALLGLSDELVISLCEKASDAEFMVVPANFNAPGQVVVAGHAEAVDRLELIAAENPDLKPRKIIPLKVSAPFHCPLMKPVREKLMPSLKSISWGTLKFPIAFNVDGEIRSEPDEVDLLARQIDSPVRWTQCAKNLSEKTDFFVETGPGKVLSGLMKRIADNVVCHSVESAEDLKSLVLKLKEKR